MIGVWRWNLFW